MIYLDTTTRKLQAVLAGAVAANQPKVSVFFYDVLPQSSSSVRRGAPQISTLNSNTDVDICDAPVLQGIIRNIHTIFVYNRDTSAVTVTIKIDDAGTETELVKQTLSAGSSLIYEDQRGWQGIDPITLPIADTTEIVKGSADDTKRIRFEVDGLTTGTTRIITVLDANFTIGAATQAEQEAASSVAVSVTPGRQHYHPCANKGWVRFAVNGSVNASFNVDSVTDTNPGDWTVVWTTDFSTANYQADVTPCGTEGSYVTGHDVPAGGTLRVWCANGSTGALTDPTTGISVSARGDQ